MTAEKSVAEDSMLDLKDGQLLRRLGTQENFWHSNWQYGNGASLLHYTMILDSDCKLERSTVQKALDGLQRKFLPLRSHVVERDGFFCFVAGSPAVSLTMLPPGEDWLKCHTRIGAESINTATGPLWTVRLLHQPSNTMTPETCSHRAVIFISICHTISDGIGNGMLCGQLVKNLDQIIRNKKIEFINAAPFCQSLEELLSGVVVPFSNYWMMQKLKSVLAFFSRPQPTFFDKFVAPFDPSGEYENKTIPTSLSPSETSRLRDLCRRHAVTVTTAVTAALCLSVDRLLDEDRSGSSSAPLRRRFMVLVNARRFMTCPQHSLLSAACFAYFSYEPAGVAGENSLWLIAADIREQLQRQIDGRLPVDEVMRFSRSFDNKKNVANMLNTTPDGRSLHDMSVSSVGELDAQFPPLNSSAVRCTELHRNYRMNAGTDHIFANILIHSVSGRLFVDISYILGRVREEIAQRFSQLVMEILRQSIEE